MNPKVKKALGIVVDVLITIFIVFSIIVTILAFTASASDKNVPSIFGYSILSVQSDSMKSDKEESFVKGDIIIGHSLNEEEKKSLKEGDIVTFFADLDGDGFKEINTHRVVRVITAGDTVSYNTKGDNNLAEDSYVTLSENVICQYKGEKIKGLGAFLDFLQTKVGFLVVIVLPLALFFAYELYYFIRTLITVKDAGKRKITAEDEEEIKRKAVEEYLRQMEEAKAAKSTEEKADNNDSENQ